MNSEEIRRTRQRLGCTARQLAEALEVDTKLVFAWESGERFPTKRHVELLRALGDRGSLRGRPAVSSKAVAPGNVLEDPAFWTIVRKIAAHPELRDEVERLAGSYDDPAAG